MRTLKNAIASTMMRLAPKAWLELNIRRRNPNFGPEYWILPKLCRKDALAIDIGGNQGWFAYYMAQLSREVHVFEPNPVCLGQIERVRSANMIIHPLGLSDKPGTMTLRYDPENTGIGTIESANTLSNNPGIQRLIKRNVTVDVLDSFALEGVACIKIDVEGHEPAVLRGARKLLSVERPCLLMELEFRHNPRTFDEVWSVLDPLGYRMLACTNMGLESVDRTRLADLQVGQPETNPEYVYNFVFAPPGRNDL